MGGAEAEPSQPWTIRFTIFLGTLRACAVVVS